MCKRGCVFPHVTQSGKHQRQVNTCDSHQFPGKYIDIAINRFGISFPQRVFTVLQHPNIKEHHYIQAFPLLCFGSNAVNFTISESHLWSSPSHEPTGRGSTLGVRHCPVWLFFESRGCAALGGSVCASVREDYLTVGVFVRRKWLGLLGRGGLMPRGGVCVGAVVLSALKVFIS